MDKVNKKLHCYCNVYSISSRNQVRKFVRDRANSAIGKHAIQDHHAQHKNDVLIANANNIKNINFKFFESSPAYVESISKRNYNDEFCPQNSDHIYYELYGHVDNKQSKEVHLSVSYKWKREGNTIHNTTDTQVFEAGTKSFRKWLGISLPSGVDDWEKGVYSVILYDHEGNYLVSDSFTMY